MLPSRRPWARVRTLRRLRGSAPVEGPATRWQCLQPPGLLASIWLDAAIKPALANPLLQRSRSGEMAALTGPTPAKGSRTPR